MKTVAVVPAWNEAQAIGEVLGGLLPRVDAVIVVDDGSIDGTADVARGVTPLRPPLTRGETGGGVHVIRHVLNRGLGAAIATGIRAALADGADIVLTFDADGQHRPEDVAAMLAPIREGRADVVIGSRMLTKEGMPFVRRVANRIGNVVTAALFGAHVSDSQSGLRAFSRAAAEQIQIRTDRMEVSSEIVAEIFRHKLRLVEVPIKSVYTTYSLSKGQSFVMGLKTLGRLIVRRALR